MTITFDIDQAGWGSRFEYADGTKLPWIVDGLIVHYGGSAISAGNPVADFATQVEREKSTLRAWQRHHVETRRWTDIGYNYAIGQSGTIFRLRGENRGGHTAGDLEPDGVPENYEKRAVVFILGGTQKPTDRALASFRRIYGDQPLPVAYHRQVWEEGSGGTRTACPGGFLIDWVKREGYAEGVDVALEPYEEEAVQYCLDNRIFTEYSIDEPGELEAAAPLKTLAVFFQRIHEDIQPSGTIDEAARIAIGAVGEDLKHVKDTLRSV